MAAAKRSIAPPRRRRASSAASPEKVEARRSARDQNPDAADAARFRQAISRVMELGPAQLAQGLALFRPRELPRGSYLLRGGEVASEIAVVVSGLLREHFLMQGGVERTKAFIVEGGITGSLADLLSGARSRAYIVAEEPSRLMVAPFAALRALNEREPAWRRLSQRSVELLFLEKAEREYELLGLDAEARYAAFTRRFPGLESRIAARHVASYLGITPVHLSRLRRRRRARPLRPDTSP